MNVPHSDAACDNFDAICYSKGASMLKQMNFKFESDEVFRHALSTYFKEFAGKNCRLTDLIKHLKNACNKYAIDWDIEQWSQTWLTTSGCSTFTLQIKDQD